ncbi:glycosyltransferase family 2 protein [Chryseobacterium zhengzhouense]|uniref:Glycosyltransferase family 2 protein n=1 Tax=Chryseobacterium zhengzhouense TaxID=1636086 RepID=A0ABW2LZG2_9FLAO
MLISVIVPVYNSAQYLEKCIDSILSQTYGNLELILVNDGSTDSSQNLIESFSKQDKRIVSINKSNTGVSDSRNAGINAASGEAICFIDSDDWIENDYLEIFVNNYKDNKTLLIQNLKRNGRTINKYSYKYYDIKAETEALFNDNNLLYSGGPVAKFYDRITILQNNILFNRNVSYGEDLIFFLDYIKHVKYIHFLDYAKYHYSHTVGSLSTKKSHPLTNYVTVQYNISQFIAWAKTTDPSTLKYFRTIQWDIIEAGIDQNIHLPLSNIREQLSLLHNAMEKNYFHFANINRKIIYLLIKSKNFFLLKQYKNMFVKLKRYL